MQRIDNINELKEACANSDGPVEGFILLEGGVKTSKTFQHFPDGFDEEYDDEPMRIEWEVFHWMGDNYEGFENDEQLTAFVIGEAMSKGALFLYDN
jgi:hypothetical protein